MYSDDEESPSPVDFVNDTAARQTQTPSPRTELLSPTSPRVLQGEIDRVRRSRRGPSDRYRRQREQTYANASSRQLLSLLIEKEYESSKLRKALNKAFDRFEAEAIRASEAERVTQETLNQFRAINEGKVAAERALARTSEELRLWKFQFEHAQSEITRAQGVVQLVERQRDDAEHAAAKARDAARRLNEQRLVSDALEEGRRLGYQAGFRRAQQELAYARDTPGAAYQDMEREIEDNRIYTEGQQEDEDPDSGLDGSPPPPQRDLNASPLPPTRSPQTFRMPPMPPSQPPPTVEDPPLAMPIPTPAMAMPSPRPAAPSRTFETESVRRAPPSARSPSIQLSRYSIDIPSASVFNDTGPSEFPQPQQQRRPSPQAQRQGPPTGNVRDDPPFRPNSGEQVQYQAQRQGHPTGSVRDARPSRPYPGEQAQHQAQRQELPTGSVRDARPSRPNPGEQAQPQAQRQEPSTYSDRDAPPPRPIPREQSQYQAPPPVTLPPDNYIPSADADGGIALPPPFQLSQPILQASTAAEAARTQSWYNRNPAEEPAAPPVQNQSWYQAKRTRSNAGSNAGSVTGRSNAGSATGRSNAGSAAGGRHTRHASLDSRMSLLNKNMKLGGNEYGTDLGPINEDARSAQRSFARETQGSEIARSMRGSTESLVPPPPPAKDPRHQKQVIADELRYSDPDLPEAWRRDAAANAETASSRSRSQPPRNVRVPAHLKMPAPLSPPKGPAPLNHMRARSMSGSTGKSGWSQPPNMMDLASRPSLRRVKEKRPISPSDFGSPYSGTINVEPPSQSSSQVPLSMSATPQMDRYLSPNYQTQPLPQPQTQPLSQPQNSLPSGFIPQSFTTPAQITVPVTFKGKSISSPVTFPTEGGSGDDNPPPRSPSGLSNYRASAHGGSNTSLNRPRSTSINASSRVGEPAPPARPLSALSNSNLSHKSGKSGKYVAGPSLTADGGYSLAHRTSTTSLRSTGSGYARFDAKSYVDPAYFAADTNAAGAVPVPAPRSRKTSAASSHSGLSYMGPPLPP